MANKVVTFLEAIGRDVKNGLVKIDPFIQKAITMAQVAAPEISALDPALGAVFSTVVATVSSIEQKFVALNQQTGTGAQKLAEATTILGPVITQAFQSSGKAADLPTVQKYISAVVNFLNAIPQSVAPAAAPAKS
jgi:hypothetical protein